MIMRVFQVTTQPGMAAEFEAFLRGTAIPLMKGTEGIEEVLFGAAREENPDEFCIVMVWRDLAALKAFVGGDYTAAHVMPEEAAMVADRRIRHYDRIA